jgi:hypothetical protein
VLELQDGSRTNDKQLIHSLRSAQTKQHVGYYIVGTFLVLEQATDNLRFIRLTTA